MSEEADGELSTFIFILSEEFRVVDEGIPAKQTKKKYISLNFSEEGNNDSKIRLLEVKNHKTLPSQI